MHQDELRVLKINRTRITWHLTFDAPTNHLKVTRFGKGLYEIRFDLTQFYFDILTKLQNRQINSSGIRLRYNSWLEFEIEGRNDLEKNALSEASKFKKLK